MIINQHSPKLSFERPKAVERIQPNQKQTKQSPGGADAKHVNKYTPSEQGKAIVYKKPTAQPDMKTIERLKAESERHHQQLIQLVKQLLARQGVTLAEAQQGSVTVEVDEDTRLKAQAAIAEGGEHSVEKVSDRLVEFAIALSGGDRSQLDTLKGAIREGFRQAEEAFGGALPDISYQTLDATLAKLDQWGAGEA